MITESAVPVGGVLLEEVSRVPTSKADHSPCMPRGSDRWIGQMDHAEPPQPTHPSSANRERMRFNWGLREMAVGGVTLEEVGRVPFGQSALVYRPPIPPSYAAVLAYPMDQTDGPDRPPAAPPPLFLPSFAERVRLQWRLQRYLRNKRWGSALLPISAPSE